MSAAGQTPVPDIRDTSFNPKNAVAWLEQQSPETQVVTAEQILAHLLQNASRPKQASGNACAKLCGFVEMCFKSKQPALANYVFSEETALRLFNFFLEWNEHDSNRTMRLILDSLVYSIVRNPDCSVGLSIKTRVLKDTISIVTLSATIPSIKSSMIILDHLVHRKAAYLRDYLDIYREVHGECLDDESIWNAFIPKIYEWMRLQYLYTVAGKLLVTIFTSPLYGQEPETKLRAGTWHRYMHDALSKNAQLLDPIKLYVFMPLFKFDRGEALIYLDNLSYLQKLTDKDSIGWDINAMLWLAMLEAGKKIGIVHEPGQDLVGNAGLSIQLPADILEIVLSHRSHEARSSAVSILIASPSSTRPYTIEALELLRKYLPSFYEDSNAKLRYDVLGHSRNMVKRLQGTIESLRRDIDRLSKKALKVTYTKEERSTSHVGDERTGSRDHEQGTTISKLYNALHAHENFVRWYAGFLKGELVPTASYQRHITALKAMGFFLRSNLISDDKASVTRWPVNVLVDAKWFRSVLDLIMDPFDDVREAAASLIMLLRVTTVGPSQPSETSSLHNDNMEELREFCQRADDLARKTARADHSDGVARSNELLCGWTSSFDEAITVPSTILANLEMKLGDAEKDLANAVLLSPVHGDFASLRYVWGSFSGARHAVEELGILHSLQDRTIQCCQRIWHAVRHILCDDSPEGHLPEELQQVEGLDTKDLLSYSFRAIHESSNLLRAIACNARNRQEDGRLCPSYENFENIGRLTFDELSNLRHRGAFTTVSQTFTACCQHVKYVSPDERHGRRTSFLDEWYKGALICIQNQASTTRRSAGIPAIIVGILASKAQSPSFDDVISKLQSIASTKAMVSETDGSNLPQVHALNCLREIFKTSFLAALAEPYLTVCLHLAANSLKSEVWAIRNCGLLFLRSLIDSLFGTNESKTSMEAGWDGRTVRLPFHKFQGLPMLLLDLLELGQESSGVLMGTQTAESVFPALDIIRRAGPPVKLRGRLYSAISWYLGSHIWHVREIAARTLCSFLLTPDWFESIKSLILEAGNSANKLHGALLTLKFLMGRLQEVMPEQLSEDNLSNLYNFVEMMPNYSTVLGKCTEASAVYIDIVTSITRFFTPGTNTNVVGILTELVGKYSLALRNENAQSEMPVALLKTRIGEATVQYTKLSSTGDAAADLEERFQTVLEKDVDIACAMLQDMSENSLANTNTDRARLASLYLAVEFGTEAPEPRTLALENLAELMDEILRARLYNGLDAMPSDETLSRLWADLYDKPINPSLSDAIIRVSGPIIATAILRVEKETNEDLSSRVTGWGAMISDAGVSDRTIDTRLAAIQALRSVSTVIELSSDSLHTAHLSWLLALYDALNDDDDEIREAAAEASSPILGQSIVAVEAGARLLRWLGRRFGHVPDFQAHVASRMVGHGFGSPIDPAATPEGWVAAELQLASAMRFDDSLFVVEEQNQYVDEVREAKRWADVFSAFPAPSSSPSTPSGEVDVVDLGALSAWALSALRSLHKIAKGQVDGPLGWTSKPQVFAICARVLICASALSSRGVMEVTDALRRFVELGRGGDVRVHGLLLDMVDVGEVIGAS
ncbi:hypothetical protein F5Y15DRAFT_397463 [Xylariaceae sp. FL0016]|nr:hypothetical protein F5Y15DRAFT_397463 [Xylariaceae sp. FL0016]